MTDHPKLTERDTASGRSVPDGLSQAEPKVSALRASIPSAGEAAAKWKDLAIRAIDCVHDACHETNWGQPTFGPSVWARLRTEQDELLAAFFEGERYGAPTSDTAAETAALLDRFAGQALSGMLASESEVDGFYQPGTAAERAYKFADAMLAARVSK